MYFLRLPEIATFMTSHESPPFARRTDRPPRAAARLGLVLVLLLGAGAIHSEVALTGVGPIVITVSDLDRSMGFYTDVLSFRKIDTRDASLDSFDRLTGLFGTNVNVANLRLGSEGIQLVEYRTPHGRLVRRDSRSNDTWFQHIAIVVSDMEAAGARLQRHKVRQISTAPQILPKWNQNAAGIKAFYFRDPDDHPLELIQFPSGKGDPRWHKTPHPAGELFLGIDHTAIVVTDTERSLRLYRDALGFRIVGESLNYGVEQDHLNHVFGSKVRITSLRSAAGPGIEFLEYLAPRNGRPTPSNTTPADLWCLQTTLIARDFPAALADLSKRRVGFVSPEPQEIVPFGEKGSKGILLRDPDGHVLLLRSPPGSL